MEEGRRVEMDGQWVREIKLSTLHCFCGGDAIKIGDAEVHGSTYRSSCFWLY